MRLLLTAAACKGRTAMRLAERPGAAGGGRLWVGPGTVAHFAEIRIAKQ